MSTRDTDQVKRLGNRKPKKGSPLTSRQEEVLILIGDGLTFAEIGAQLGITERTVKAFSDKLRAKFDVQRSRDLIPCARRYFSKAPMVPRKRASQ